MNTGRAGGRRAVYREQEGTLPYRYVLKGASDGLHERAQRYTSFRPLTEGLQLAIGKKISGKRLSITTTTVSLYGFPL